jgi:hypothetical protein
LLPSISRKRVKISILLLFNIDLFWKTRKLLFHGALGYYVRQSIFSSKTQQNSELLSKEYHLDR